MLASIAAMAQNRVIGRDGTLPWRLRDDLAHFKKTTMGRVMIMGRKTFDETGKPLPGRTSVVTTRDQAWVQPDYPTVHVAHSIADALQLAADLTSSTLGSEANDDPDRCPVVIGGGIIYSETLRLTRILDLTEVHAEVDGDTSFPHLDTSVWKEISRTEHCADDRNEFSFSIVRYLNESAASL